MNLIDKAKDLLHDETLRGCVPDRVMVVLRELAALKPVATVFKTNIEQGYDPEDWNLFSPEYMDDRDCPLYTLETRHE